MNHIQSRPPFYLEAWIWAKHYNSESPILNFWRSFQGNSRKLKHQHFGEIPSPPVGLDRYDLSRGFIPSPSDQSDHPRKPSPLVISTRQASSKSRKIRWVSGVFFCFFVLGPYAVFLGCFSRLSRRVSPAPPVLPGLFFIKLKKQVKLSFAKTIPWVGRWSFPFLGASWAVSYIRFFWEVFHQCFKNSQLKTSIPHPHWT